jgi:nucleoside-diphosphate-sugar epimerase
VKVLVTGASGFVGRNVAEGLAGRHQVLAPRHAELDVLDPVAFEAYVRDQRVDAIVHSAVRGGEQVLEQTLRMQASVLRCASLVDRILYFGSGAEYAKTRDLKKVREESIGEFVPKDPYGLAKLFCNEAARGRKRVLNLRLFGVYGPHEGYLLKFISNSIVKRLLGLDLRIRQDVVFDYLWVADLVGVVGHFLEASFDHADLNVTPTESISLTGIVRIIDAAVGSKGAVEIDTPGMNWQYTGDNARLLAAMPGLRFTGYPQGIAELVEFYERDDAIDREAVIRDDYARRAKVRQA